MSRFNPKPAQRLHQLHGAPPAPQNSRAARRAQGDLRPERERAAERALLDDVARQARALADAAAQAGSATGRFAERFRVPPGATLRFLPRDELEFDYSRFDTHLIDSVSQAAETASQALDRIQREQRRDRRSPLLRAAMFGMDYGSVEQSVMSIMSNVGGRFVQRTPREFFVDTEGNHLARDAQATHRDEIESMVAAGADPRDIHHSLMEYVLLYGTRSIPDGIEFEQVQDSVHIRILKSRQPPPPHPDAGKEIARPPRMKRSVLGLEVRDIRNADGSVSRLAAPKKPE